MPLTEKMDAAKKNDNREVSETVCAARVCPQQVRLCVLTVSQRLNLLAKSSEIRVSESILG